MIFNEETHLSRGGLYISYKISGIQTANRLDTLYIEVPIKNYLMGGIRVRHPALAGPPRPACALIDIRGAAGCRHPILTWKAVMRAGRWHTERTGVPVPDSGRRNRVPRGRSSMPAKHQDRPSPSFRCCANSTPPIRPHERRGPGCKPPPQHVTSYCRPNRSTPAV